MSGKHIILPTDCILVTGSNGFIGTRVIETLLAYGFSNLRCFVRPSSQTERLKEVLCRYPSGKNVQLISGDLLSRNDCIRATEGASIIYHLAQGSINRFQGPS